MSTVFEADNLVNGPLISIITIVYNADKRLEQTILSVIKQSYGKIEYIIIDGGSWDQTIDIIKKYENKISYWKSEPDKGIYDAMNKGINVAKGEWIYFLGAGDILFDVLHKITPAFINKNTIYYGDVYKLDELKVYNGRFSGLKLAVKNICHQAIFYPRSVFKKFGYNLKYKMQADHDLNMRCFGDSDFIFKYIPVIISLYEGAGISAFNPDIAFFEDKLDIIKNNFSFFVYCYAFMRNRIAKVFKTNSYASNNKN
ncbi:MAG: glycosyltransferase [Mucilaginibacter sp.]|nr:glycosyltransferase [Mucilaginibacter sp.]